MIIVLLYLLQIIKTLFLLKKIIGYSYNYYSVAGCMYRLQ